MQSFSNFKTIKGSTPKTTSFKALIWFGNNPEVSWQERMHKWEWAIKCSCVALSL